MSSTAQPQNCTIQGQILHVIEDRFCTSSKQNLQVIKVTFCKSRKSGFARQKGQILLVACNFGELFHKGARRANDREGWRNVAQDVARICDGCTREDDDGIGSFTKRIKIEYKMISNEICKGKPALHTLYKPIQSQLDV